MTTRCRYTWWRYNILHNRIFGPKVVVILRDVTFGFNAKLQSQLTVSYSPDYGSQAVASFTSSLENIIAVDNSGNLTLQ